jgi:hypothetical protein
MMNKQLLAPERVRQLPRQFSWIDQQLVRGGHLDRSDHAAWALYLLLVTVADAQGLSYYSEAPARANPTDQPQRSGSFGRRPVATTHGRCRMIAYALFSQIRSLHQQGLSAR